MKTQTINSEKVYWAFISYSSSDKKWGAWIHRKLESYPIPQEFHNDKVFDGAVLGKNLRPVFRDRDELAGSAALAPAILEALEKSRFLIVLCSPNSAQSKWVNTEIEDFKALKDGNDKRILALILDGEPNATSNNQSDNSLECFPPSLRYPLEPLAGDLRKEGDGKERGFLKILAGITQLNFDTLYRRHERAQQRKRMTLTGVAITVITLLTALSIIAITQKKLADNNAQIAHDKTAEAKRQEKLTAEQRDIARANEIEAKQQKKRAQTEKTNAKIQLSRFYLEKSKLNVIGSNLKQVLPSLAKATDLDPTLLKQARVQTYLNANMITGQLPDTINPTFATPNNQVVDLLHNIVYNHAKSRVLVINREGSWFLYSLKNEPTLITNGKLTEALKTQNSQSHTDHFLINGAHIFEIRSWIDGSLIHKVAKPGDRSYIDEIRFTLGGAWCLRKNYSTSEKGNIPCTLHFHDLVNKDSLKKEIPSNFTRGGNIFLFRHPSGRCFFISHHKDKQTKDNVYNWVECIKSPSHIEFKQFHHYRGPEYFRIHNRTINKTIFSKNLEYDKNTTYFQVSETSGSLEVNLLLDALPDDQHMLHATSSESNKIQFVTCSEKNRGFLDGSNVYKLFQKTRESTKKQIGETQASMLAYLPKSKQFATWDNSSKQLKIYNNELNKQISVIDFSHFRQHVHPNQIQELKRGHLLLNTSESNILIDFNLIVPKLAILHSVKPLDSSIKILTLTGGYPSSFSVVSHSGLAFSNFHSLDYKSISAYEKTQGTKSNHGYYYGLKCSINDDGQWKALIRDKSYDKVAFLTPLKKQLNWKKSKLTRGTWKQFKIGNYFIHQDYSNLRVLNSDFKLLWKTSDSSSNHIYNPLLKDASFVFAEQCKPNSNLSLLSIEDNSVRTKWEIKLQKMINSIDINQHTNRVLVEYRSEWNKEQIHYEIFNLINGTFVQSFTRTNDKKFIENGYAGIKSRLLGKNLLLLSGSKKIHVRKLTEPNKTIYKFHTHRGLLRIINNDKPILVIDNSEPSKHLHSLRIIQFNGEKMKSKIIKLNSGHPTTLATPHSNLLLIKELNNTHHLYNTTSMKVVSVFKDIESVKWNPAGDKLYGVKKIHSRTAIVELSVESGDILSTYLEHRRHHSAPPQKPYDHPKITDFSLSPNGEWLISLDSHGRVITTKTTKTVISQLRMNEVLEKYVGLQINDKGELKPWPIYIDQAKDLE